MKLSTLAVLFCVATVHAQLAVTVTPPKVVGQKAIVSLAMTNNLADKIESARAICFLLDEHGQMVGQSSRWVIGGIRERPALAPKLGTTFNFVITGPHLFPTTNLTANVSFSRVILEGNKLADPKKSVQIQNGK